MRVSRLPLHAVVGTGRLTWLATSRTAGRRPARTMPVQAFTKASVKRLRPGVLRTAPGNGALVGAGFLSPAWPPSRRRRRHGWRHPRRRHALQSRRGLRLAPALHAHERGPRRRRAAARGPHRELCGHGPGRAPGGGGGARRLGAGRTAAVGVLNTRLYLPDGSGARPDRRGLRPRPLPGHGDHGRCPWPARHLRLQQHAAGVERHGDVARSPWPRPGAVVTPPSTPSSRSAAKARIG